MQTAKSRLPVLHSIDVLLNRFDQLSQRHSELASTFEKSLFNIENPLKDISRNEEAQQQTIENMSFMSCETIDQVVSLDNAETFNRYVTKSRCGNRPPNYSSNDSFSILNRVASRSSWLTGDSIPLVDLSSSTTQKSIGKTSIEQSNRRIGVQENSRPINESGTKTKCRILPSNPSPSPFRRTNRQPITTFTMETVNRLSKPKNYHSSPDHVVVKKSSPHRSKFISPMKKEAIDLSNPSLLSSGPSMQSKRTMPIRMKSPPKKLRSDSKDSVESLKRFPLSNYPRPTIHRASPNPINLTIPFQTQARSSRVIMLPPSTSTTSPKTKSPSNIASRRAMLARARIMQLMT